MGIVFGSTVSVPGLSSTVTEWMKSLARSMMGAASRSLDILKGKTLLLLWFEGSTRMWNSFTSAMEQLRGFVRFRDAKDMWLRLEEKPGTGLQESPKDTALVLDRYVDALGIRLFSVTPEQVGDRAPRWGDAHAIMHKFADYMKVPVISMASDMHHPTQSLANNVRKNNVTKNDK